jgi:hypothetical protein
MDENVIRDPARTTMYASGTERPIQSISNIPTRKARFLTDLEVRMRECDDRS